MWNNNNGFANNGMFPGFNSNNANNLEEFPPSPFATNPSPANGYFPQQQMHPNMMQFDNFHPDPGAYNQDAFMQNQQAMSADAQFPPPPPAFSMPPNTPQNLPVALNARAAELRQRLMKGKEARGATPPVGKVVQPKAQAPDSSSSVALPKPLLTGLLTHPEQDLQELISSFSDSVAAPTEKPKEMKDESVKTLNAAKRIPTGPSSLAKSQELSFGSPKIASKLSTNGNTTGNNLTTHSGSRLASQHDSPSDMSEGEILEEPLPLATTPLASRLKQKLPVVEKKQEEAQKVAKVIDPVRRQSRDDALPKPAAREQRQDLPSAKAPPPSKAPPSTNTQSQAQRNREGRDDRRSERRDSFEGRPDRRPFQPEQRFERSNFPENDQRSYGRRDSRDEEYRRAEAKVEHNIQPKVEPKREEKARVPTLEQVLPHDHDVREWLEITGYHNVDYRNKILDRRRQIAILDAQREKLIAEMAAEEGGMRAPTPGMAPPPVPQKLEPSALATEGAQRDLPVANKRPYSEMEPRKDGGGGPEKMPRLEDRGQRVKEEDLNDRRPNSKGDDTNQASGGRRAQRDNRFDDDRRTVQRSLSTDPEASPGRRAYESRPPARRADDDLRYYDGPRSSYQGRGYDPNYSRGRGAGRGRGRGGGGGGGGVYQNDSVTFSPRGTNSKSFKDHGSGYDKGRNGGL